MKRNYVIFCILILGFLSSCDRQELDTSNVSIETILEADYNYRYDDLLVKYEIQNSNLNQVKLRCRLIGDSDKETYTTHDFSIDNLSLGDTLSLIGLDWFVSDKAIDFYNIENQSCGLQILLISNNQLICESNKIVVEINRLNPDTSLIDNFIIYDIYGEKIEFIRQLENKDFLFFFDFATWCGWSKLSIPKVNQIDSLFGDRISVLGVEGSPSNYVNYDYLEQFVVDRGMQYPVIVRADNTILNDLLHPDNSLSFPRFLLISKDRKEKYRQVGYIENMIDSIEFYINKN